MGSQRFGGLLRETAPERSAFLRKNALQGGVITPP